MPRASARAGGSWSIWEGAVDTLPPICLGWVLFASVCFGSYISPVNSVESFISDRQIFVPVPPLKQWSRSRPGARQETSLWLRGTSRKVHIQNHRKIDSMSIDIWKAIWILHPKFPKMTVGFLKIPSLKNVFVCLKIGYPESWFIIIFRIQVALRSWGSSSACFRQPHSLKPSPSRVSLEVVGHFLGPIRDLPCAVVFRRRS